jgi:hypothetical protein
MHHIKRHCGALDHGYHAITGKISIKHHHGNSQLRSNHDKITNCVAFFHVSLFSPSLSIWCDAIDAGHFTTWPGLTSAQVRRHPPPYFATHKWHIDQQRDKNLSTHPSPAVAQTDGPTDVKEAHDDTFPPDPPASRSHYIYAECRSSTGMMYMDPTYHFPQPSTSGNWYVLVVYDSD